MSQNSKKWTFVAYRYFERMVKQASQSRIYKYRNGRGNIFGENKVWYITWLYDIQYSRGAKINEMSQSFDMKYASEIVTI